MKKYILLFICFISIEAIAQKQNITGVVKNTKNELLEGVTLILSPPKKGTYTNSAGQFYFKNIKNGTYNIQASYVGYKTINKTIVVSDNMPTISITLKEKTVDLSEVIISYDKVKAIKKEKPLTIEVVNKDFIQQNLAGSLSKSLEKIPGITIISIGSGQAKPSIRGLSFNRVLVADKGLKHEAQQWGADHGLEIDQYAINNLKVIKGPSSLIYGSDAIGGVIDIDAPEIPKKNDFNGELNSSYMSNNNSFSNSLFVSKRFENWFAQARFTKTIYSDYKVPADFVDIYDYRVPLYKNHLRNTAGNETNYHLNFGYQNNTLSSVFYGSVYDAKIGFFANAHGLEPLNVDEALHDASSNDILNPSQNVKHYKLINKTKLLFDTHTLDISTGIQRNIRNEKNNYISHGFMPPIFPDTLSFSRNLERKFDKTFFAIKAIDKFKVDNHSFTVGLDAQYQKNIIDGWGFIIPNFKQYNFGLFAIDNFKLSEKITLNGGIRYDFANINVKQYIDWYPSTKENGEKEYIERVSPFNKNFHNLSLSAGINYTNNNFDLKVNIGNGFRMPNPKELTANGVNYHFYRYEKGNKDINPERSYQFDVSIEWNFQNWAIQISPFINYFSNYIYLNPTPNFDYLSGAGNQIFNYSQSKVFRYGGEIHAHIDILKNLKLGGSLEYVKSKQLTGEKKGFGLPFSPPLSVLLNPKYSFNSNGIFINPYLSANYRITASQLDIVPPEETTNGYQTLNINAGSSLKLGNYLVDLTLQVQNVFDKKYFNHTNFYRLINLPEQGRNIVLSANINF